MVKQRAQLAVVLGIGTACTAAALVTAFRVPGTDDLAAADPSATRECAGARVTLNSRYDAPFTVELAIDDPGRRVWRVRGGSALVSVSASDGSATVEVATRGAEDGIRLEVRPDAGGDWCGLRVDPYVSGPPRP